MIIFFTYMAIFR